MAFDEKHLQRRVAGYHDIRLDGILDIVLRCRGASVMDVGCNRGMVGLELAQNGASLIHGCDNYAEGVQAARDIFNSMRGNAYIYDDPNPITARHAFADLRAVQSQFEVVDLTQGPTALAPFHGASWDIVLVLATIHKLKRAMPQPLLSELVRHLGNRCQRFFAWRATSEKFDENEAEMAMLDRDLAAVSMRRVHTSYLSRILGVAAIWAKGY